MRHRLRGGFGLALLIFVSGASTHGAPAAPGRADSTTPLVAVRAPVSGAVAAAAEQSVIWWASPAPIPVGTALSAAQLNSTASAPGTLTYNPPIGTAMDTPGRQSLSVSFTPADPSSFTSATASVSLDVVAAYGATSAVHVAGGGAHTCVLTGAGTVECWGNNRYGELGDGTTIDRVTPTPVAGLGRRTVALAVGGGHTCALDDAGAVWCWGENDSGQLGDGTLTNRSNPIQVPGLPGAMTAIAAGMAHTCAAAASGGVWCWGLVGSEAQLGRSVGLDNSVALPVAGLSFGVKALAAGDLHTCALTSIGLTLCWGWNGVGQLGDGTTDTRPAPTVVKEMGTRATAIAAGGDSTCAVVRGGAVECWGAGPLLGNQHYQNPVSTPVSGLTAGVRAVSVSDDFACAVMDVGDVRCWGTNYDGVLGDGTTASRYVPSLASTVGAPVTGIGAGMYHACAVLSGGGLKCWGRNTWAQLGTGSLSTRSVEPVRVVGIGTGAKDVAVTSSTSYTCGVSVAGAILCWGDFYVGSGRSTALAGGTPSVQSGITSGAVALSEHGQSTCARMLDGSVKCGTPGSTWAVPSGLDHDVIDVATAYGMLQGGKYPIAGSRTCAVTGAGAALCWGWNYGGMLGDGTSNNRTTPTPVVGLGSGVKGVTMGPFHTCVVTTAGSVQCWGMNTEGQFGTGPAQMTPALVTGLESGVDAVVAGHAHTCALKSGGAVVCWGRNGSGELGDGTTVGSGTPTAVVGLSRGVASIAAGGVRSCAVLQSGAVVCWGAGTSVPIQVAGLVGLAVKVSVDSSHACALSSGGVVQCWGANDHGQLGTEIPQDETTPQPVYGYGKVVELEGVSPAAGSTAGGTAVVISGQRFVRGVAVAFDGMPAPEIWIADQRTLVVTTPAHAAGSATVIVTNPDAQSATLAGAFTYAADPAGATLHPADTNGDARLTIEEVTAYGAAWLTGATWPSDPNPIPIAYVTRAGLIWRNGETYGVQPGPCPACWVSVPSADARVTLPDTKAQAAAAAKR